MSVGLRKHSAYFRPARVRVKWHMEGRKRVFDYVKVPRGVTVVSAT